MLHLIQFWRFSRELNRHIVVTYRKITRQLFYFDQTFYSQKHVRMLERVDSLMRDGVVYKDSPSTTVAQIDFEGKPLIIKRYNTHSIVEGIKQIFKVSRAYNSWFYAHWMLENNILTPKPLVVIEQKLSWLRKRSYYVYQALELSLLRDVLLTEALDSPKSQNFQERIVDLFKSLQKARVHHRDFKITNFLVNQNEVYLIDLDHMSYDLTGLGLKRMLRRDKKRFLKNFKDHPELFSRFETLLDFI